MALNLFPVRAAIGRATVNGQVVDVMMTPEFARALASLSTQLDTDEGGADELEILASFSTTPAPASMVLEDALSLQFFDTGALAGLAQQVQDLKLQFDALIAPQNSALEQRIDDLQLGTFSDPYRVNWERPGTIGSSTPNSGAFTTLSATAAVTLNPANASVNIKPSGTGIVDIQPATVGAINRMNIGAAVAATGAFTTLTASGAVTFSPAATVTIKPSGAGIVDIQPATVGAMNRMNIGAVVPATGAFTTLSATTSIACAASVYQGGATVVVPALATPTTFPGINATAGVLRIRDNTLGGSSLWLLDPNAGPQLIGVNQIAGLTVVNGGGGLGFAWQANLSAGAVPRTLAFTMYS